MNILYQNEQYICYELFKSLFVFAIADIFFPLKFGQVIPCCATIMEMTVESSFIVFTSALSIVLPDNHMLKMH